MAPDFLCPMSDAPCVKPNCTRNRCADEVALAERRSAADFERNRKRDERTVLSFLADPTPNNPATARASELLRETIKKNSN